jgi:hypothetical protein
LLLRTASIDTRGRCNALASDEGHDISAPTIFPLRFPRSDYKRQETNSLKG